MKPGPPGTLPRVESVTEVDRLAPLRASRPVEVAGPAARRVTAVIPCYNRQRDLDLLLGDLAGLRVPAGVALDVLVVDNASEPPLRAEGARVSLLRARRNEGGSGGFNAGMAAAMSRGTPHAEGEFLWLLDSDVRLDEGALGPLLEALESDAGAVAAASGLHEPASGAGFEAGGYIDRASGEYVQQTPGGAETRRVEYAAACSLLVPRWAAEAAGPMGEFFVSGDDVEWCLRLARATGGHVLAVPSSRAVHPRPDRMRTGARYFAARNAFAAMEAAGCGVRCRLRRALREVGRAACQTMMGRDDLARLHLQGLRDALDGVRGPMPPDLKFEAPRPLETLPAAIREAVGARGVGRVSLGLALDVDADRVAASLRRLAVNPARVRDGAEWSSRIARRSLRRLLTGPPHDLAVVSARGRPVDWMAGRVLVTVWEGGFVIRRIRRRERAAALARVLWEGAGVSWRLSRARPASPGPKPALSPATRRGTVAVVVVSYNRAGALLKTLEALAADTDFAGAPVIVVDNGSSDGTPERLRESRGENVTLVALEENLGIAAYNRGVAQAEADYVLILDDDARPDAGAVAGAAALLDARPDLAGVALHPRHPENGRSEWGFAPRARATEAWPFMGCGNLVRRSDWLRAGGYEPAFFLYRNDTDLALTFLAMGRGVHFNPAWVVWHDSPAAARKSPRWFRLATRNWVWVCKRHGAGATRAAAILRGWAWAHRLAGLSVGSHLRVLCGVLAGLLRRAPALPTGIVSDGTGLRGLLAARRGQVAASTSSSSPRHSA